MSYTSTKEGGLVKSLISSTQAMTASYVDIGPRINTKGLCNIAMWLKGTLNDSDKVMFRIKCFRTETDTDVYYPQIQSVSSNEVTLEPEVYSLTQLGSVVPLGISELAPWIQFEIKVNTAGATPADVDEAYITYNRRD